MSTVPVWIFKCSWKGQVKLVGEKNIGRVSPLGHEHVTLTGPYRIALPDTLCDRAAYRPRKTPTPDAAAA